MRRLLDSDQIDLVTFASSSSVRAFWELVGGLGRARAVAIGPITAATVREVGMGVALVAAEHTVEGLVAACEAAAARNTG